MFYVVELSVSIHPDRQHEAGAGDRSTGSDRSGLRACEIQGNEVIHRIIDEQGGQYIFKGDNNQIADFNPVAKEQIQGKVIFYSNLPAPLIRKARNLQE